MSLRDVGFYLRARLSAGLTRCGQPRPSRAGATCARSMTSWAARARRWRCRDCSRGASNARSRGGARLPGCRRATCRLRASPLRDVRGARREPERGRRSRRPGRRAGGSPRRGARQSGRQRQRRLGRPSCCTLLERWMAREPTGVRVRLLFPACEELGYLGARVWVRDHGVGGIAGVLSLELPGVGDSLAVWDAVRRHPVSRHGSSRVRGARPPRRSGLSRGGTHSGLRQRPSRVRRRRRAGLRADHGAGARGAGAASVRLQSTSARCFAAAAAARRRSTRTTPRATAAPRSTRLRSTGWRTLSLRWWRPCAKRRRFGGRLREKQAGAVDLTGRDHHHHLALGADAERVDGVGQA